MFVLGLAGGLAHLVQDVGDHLPELVARVAIAIVVGVLAFGDQNVRVGLDQLEQTPLLGHVHPIAVSGQLYAYNGDKRYMWSTL